MKEKILYQSKEIEIFIPANKSRICLDCEAIHNQSCCPACASEQWWWLSKWNQPNIIKHGLRK
jgi:hypothetical protein